jgi:DNA polymerase IV
MSAERVILHADMDAFYASIEQRDRPELRGRPVIVGATSARGVVAAASYEARRYGVHSAMPGFEARKLCPHAVFVPPNMTHYAAVSAEIHTELLRYTPCVEPLALDEAFLDITGTARLFGTPEQAGRSLKAAVLARTGLIVSIGIGPNKLIAKLACSLGKPDGLKQVAAAEVPAFLAPLPVRRLWGVGPVLEAALRAAGFATCGDLVNAELPSLEQVAGAGAARLQDLARGHDPRPVESARETKSVGEESTFEQDLSDRTRVSEALTSHAQTVARRLRHLGAHARTISLKIRLSTPVADRSVVRARANPYPLLSRSQTLPHATDDDAVIRRVSLELWDRAEVTTPVRLLGVSASNLEFGPRTEQLELFGAPRRNLGSTLDAIQARFGPGAIGRAVHVPEKQAPSDRSKPGER